MHSGLSSSLNDCGAPDWYAYVFVGSISSITPAAKDEEWIQIIPEEVFKGEPPTPVRVITKQAACLPTLSVGDRWLFFLRGSTNDNPILLDYYGNDSLPVADAHEQIETLRRLISIGDLGILRGRVMKDCRACSAPKGFEFPDGTAVPNASVVAHRQSDNAQFVATTDSDGRYEFQPLVPGKYKLTVDAIGSFRPDDSEIEVNRGRCWELTLSKTVQPHARLEGHVRYPDGSSVPRMGVLLTSEDGSWWHILNADALGHFRFDSLPPGKYVLGVSMPNAPPWKYGAAGTGAPPAALQYYPGVSDRSSALVVTLAEDEERDDIDFVVPTQ
jgi:Carboxypeptidase regulatory-like domain